MINNNSSDVGTSVVPGSLGAQGKVLDNHVGIAPTQVGVNMMPHKKILLNIERDFQDWTLATSPSFLGLANTRA